MKNPATGRGVRGNDLQQKDYTTMEMNRVAVFEQGGQVIIKQDGFAPEGDSVICLTWEQCEMVANWLRVAANEAAQRERENDA